MKATTLNELNDREEMDFSGFIENLKTYKMEMKVREERETPKKKVIAFNATPSTINEKDSSEDGDEDFSMLIRRVGKIFYKKGRKATSEEEDIKEDLKRRRRRRVLLSLQDDGPPNCGLPLTSSHYLQERA